MCPNFGFVCWVFVRRGTKSNISAKMEVEKSLEAVKAEINEVVDPILKHEPSYLDVPPKGELFYII